MTVVISFIVLFHKNNIIIDWIDNCFSEWPLWLHFNKMDKSIHNYWVKVDDCFNVVVVGRFFLQYLDIIKSFSDWQDYDLKKILFLDSKKIKKLHSVLKAN